VSARAAHVGAVNRGAVGTRGWCVAVGKTAAQVGAMVQQELCGLKPSPGGASSTGPGPIRCTIIFQLFKNCSNLVIQICCLP
jgi:hypothetical protein